VRTARVGAGDREWLTVYLAADSACLQNGVPSVVTGADPSIVWLD
jgi:hypothetical protein